MEKEYTNPLHTKHCIFCLDGDGLKKNTSCKCNYLYHPNCRELWADSNRRENKPVCCVMCRAEEEVPQEEVPQQIFIVIPLEEPVERFIRCRSIIAFIIVIFIAIALLVAYRLFF